MIRPLLALLLLAALASPLAAASRPAEPLAPGQVLPPLAGQTLTGRHATLPDAAAGRVTLLLLGFTYESRHAVEAWAERFTPRYGGDPLVSLWEVPMMTGSSWLAKPFIVGGMRRGTPQPMHDNVLCVWKGAAAWKPRVGLEHRDDPCLIVLDADGRIEWLHRGAPDDAGWSALQSAIASARARAPR